MQKTKPKMMLKRTKKVEIEEATQREITDVGRNIHNK